jgi:hypothetical protein
MHIPNILGVFDTLLLMGNNLALLGNPGRARWLLRHLQTLVNSHGRIVGQLRDPYKTDLAEHLAYHRRNRENGKLAGEARIRIRYKKFASQWMDYLFVSPEELEQVIADTHWKLTETIEDPSGQYVAVLDKY